MIKSLILIILNLLLICNLSLNSIQTHPIPLIFNEFIINYQKDNITLKYRLSIDPTVINKIYPLIDQNLDEKTSKEELTLYWNEIVKPNLIALINDQNLEFEIKDVFLIHKSDFRSLNDYLEITLESKVEIETSTEINVYFKYNHKYLPEDPYGDSVNFIDNIANNPQIERLDDIQYFQSLNGNEYNAKFRFIQTKKEISVQNQSELKFNINKLTNDLINNFKGLDFSNPLVAISGFFIILIAGILHAFTPGHGKTILAVVLTNKKDRNIIDLIILAISIVVSHTGIIILLGSILYIFNLGTFINSISTFIKDLIAIVFIIFGIYLIYKSYKMYKYNFLKKKVLLHANISLLGKQTNTNFSINRKSIIYTGLLSGLTPCVEALSIFILFLNLGRIDIALLSTIIFSIGLITSIFIIGIFIIYTGEKNKFLQTLETNSQYLVTFISGLIIITISFLNIIQK